MGIANVNGLHPGGVPFLVGGNSYLYLLFLLYFRLELGEFWSTIFTLFWEQDL